MNNRQHPALSHVMVSRDHRVRITPRRRQRRAKLRLGRAGFGATLTLGRTGMFFIRRVGSFFAISLL